MMELDFFLNKIREKKISCVKNQRFESATNWRDVEKYFILVIEGVWSLDYFYDVIENSEYNNYDEIYKIVKQIERKTKLLIIEKSNE